MQLISRQRKILNLLISNQHEFLSSQKIADYLGVTSKTVQSDITVIRDKIRIYKLNIVSARGKGYKLDLSDTDELILINVLSKLRKQESQDVDVSIFICKVLSQPSYTTQQDIMDLLWIGASQLKDVLSKVVLELSQHNLIIKSVPGSGFLIIGPELGKRLAFVYHFNVLESNEAMYQRFIEDRNFNKLDLDYNSVNIIENLLEENGYFLNEISRKYLFYYFNYTKFSLLDRWSILNSEHVLPYFDGLNLDDHGILFELCGYNYTELRYLKALLFFLVNESNVNEQIKYTHKEMYLIQKVERFFSRRDVLFSNSFQDVERLKKDIIKSLIIMTRKNSIGYREVYLNLDYIDKGDENVVAIEFASLLLFQIENDLRIEFYREDVIRLAMIFNIHFFKDIWAKYNRFIIYSDNSLTQVRFLKRKLELAFPFVKILEANRSNINDIVINPTKDLFIYEKEMDKKGYENEVVFESFTLVSEIIQYLQEFLNDNKFRKKTFMSLFSSERFHCNKNFTNRNDVVSWICDLYKTGEKRKSVIQANVYTREIRYIPTVYNRAAYPKIYINLVSSPRVEVIILEKPILWGNDEVDVIFVIILPNSYDSLNILGQPFYQIRQNANLIRKISACRSFDEMMRFLQTEINNYFKN